MIAALFLRHVDKCRSRQLYATLILPPVNHFECGEFHSRTVSHGLNQCRASACFAQNAAGSAAASAYSRSYSSKLPICAFFANSEGGGKTRCSFRIDSIAMGSGI